MIFDSEKELFVWYLRCMSIGGAVIVVFVWF